MSPGWLLLAAAASLGLGAIAGPRYSKLWLGLTAAAAASGLCVAVLVLTGQPEWEWRSEFAVGGEPLHLRLDGVSALFLALVCAGGAAGAIYGREYWSDHHYPGSAARGRCWWSAMLLGMGLVLVSSNGLHFLLAWELFAVSGYFLITLDRGRREARTAGWLYLAASHTGTICLFAFFSSLAARTGSWELGPMRERAELSPLFWLVLLGFGVKAGFFPLHVWLPSAHANAPSHVSALFSGVALKMGIYGLVRFSGWLPLPASAGWVVAGLGAISALFGISFAFEQTDLKRLLAYSSIENIGIILMGLGGACLAATQGNAAWGQLALAGAMLHVWNHGLFKSLLFFSAGSVVHATGVREMSRLGGLWRAMPWTAGLFALGSAAVAGLPPLNGFVGEWLVYLGLFDAAISRSPTAWIAMPGAIILAVAGALTLASFVKAGAMVFLGAPRTKATAGARECGPWMRWPMLCLAGACVLIGLAPALFWPMISRVLGAWYPAWAGVAAPAPLAKLGILQASFAIAMVAAAAFLFKKARANGLRRELTWDCGYASPSPRMQYTSGSFSRIVSGWLVWLLRPDRILLRPRGPLPQKARFVERLPETVLEHIINPAARAAMRLSLVVRRLQHGRLQAYVLYFVAGLAALGFLVLFGAAS